MNLSKREFLQVLGAASAAGLSLGRYADAESAFREALAQEPNDAFALHHLAGCRWQMPERRKEALQTIDTQKAQPVGAKLKPNMRISATNGELIASSP